MADELKMLDELEALEKKATKGPWEVGDCIAPYLVMYHPEVNGLPDPPTTKIVTGYCDIGGVMRSNLNLCAKLRNALPLLLRLARRGLKAGEVVEEIAETCENLQHAAMLNVGDYIHVQGLRGGVEKIKAMADAALSRLAAKEAR